MLGASLVVVGIVAFGIVRRKKLLYKSISDKISGVAGNADNPFGGSANPANCQVPSPTIDRYAKQIRDAVEIVSLTEGLTDEDAILTTIAQIQTKACMARVSQRYYQLYDEDMELRMRSELSGTDLDDYETEINNLR